MTNKAVKTMHLGACLQFQHSRRPRQKDYKLEPSWSNLARPCFEISKNGLRLQLSVKALGPVPNITPTPTHTHTPKVTTFVINDKEAYI